MSKGLLLWDIDGTLVKRRNSNRTSIHLEALNMPPMPNESATELTGLTDWEVLKHYSTDLKSVETSFIKLDELQENESHYEFQRIKGIDDSIFNNLKEKWNHGILTGNSFRRATFKLEAVGLKKHFSENHFYVCRQNETRLNIAERMIKHLDNAYEYIVLIGDTKNDIKTAKEIALPIIAVATGKYDFLTLAELNPTLAIKDLESDLIIFQDFLNSMAM